jgi:Carboxypeptidase regulatory-like domain/Phosphoesterase family
MTQTGGGVLGGARLALSLLGAVTLTMVGAFGAAPPVIARTTPVIGPPTHATSPAALTSAATAGGAPHIMVIVEENEGYTDVLGSSSPATYLKSLANTYASATNWYAVQHNSPHDYLDLIVGSDLGLPNGKPYSTTTLVDELHSAGIPWKSYMESMPSNCFTGTTSNGLYDPNHNPFHYFTKYSSSSGGWCNSANLSSEGIVPYPGATGPNSLASDLDAANAPDFVFLVPNDCDEMHGGVSTCANSSNSQLIMAGDTWLNTNLAPVLNSTWFQQNGIVIITWDEGSDSSGCCGLRSPGGHIATIVVAAGNKGVGPFTTTGDHYGTLRALEEAYGVGSLGGSSNTVNGDLTGAFGKAPTTGSISGTVLDSQNPAHGVTTATVSYSGSGGTGSTSTINPTTGAYTITGVPAGSYTVTATATGYTTKTQSGVSVSAGKTTTQNFVMPATSGISGTVVDTETPAKPVTAATVSYSGINGSGSTTSINSGTGAYTLSGVPAGTYSVTASATGYTSQTVSGVVVSAGTTTPGVNFTLTANSGISGTVSDTESPARPVSGASVVYAGTGSTTGSGSTTTNTSGLYSFPGLPSGTYSVSVSESGFTTPTPQNVTVTSGKTATANFTMAANSSISGTVSDTESPAQPVNGATVSYAGTGTSVGSGTIQTSSGGSYTFNGVPPGTYSVSVSDTGFTTPAAQNVTVMTSTPLTGVNFTLTANSSISGTVTDSSDNPIPSATIMYAGTGSSTGSGSVTTSAGSYKFSGVPPGTYTISASAPGYSVPPSQNVTISVNGTATANFVMAAFSTIQGTVTDSNGGAGLDGATVTYAGPGGSGTTATNDANGDYMLIDVPAGSYSVTASDAGYAPETFTVTVNGSTETQPFVLTAGTAGSIAGSVVDAQTSQPIAGATVSDGIDASVTTDASGDYVIENVTPNTDTVTASKSGYVTATTSVTVASSASTQQNFSLNEDGGVTGTVTDSVTHAAIPNASVTCTCQGPATTTNSSGVYTFTLIAPGSYTITVTATGYTGQTSAPFSVSPGATTTHNFQLVSTAKPLGVVQSFGKAATTAGTTLAATTGTATTLGDLLVVTVKDRSTPLTNVTGITDSSGTNVWAKATSIQSSGQADEEIWYAANAKSVTSVTVTISGSASLAMTVVEISGATTAPLDKTMTATGTGTATSTGTTPTTAQASEIVIANIGWNSTVTLSGQTAGYTVLPLQQATVPSNASGEQAAWRILTTTGAQSYAATLSGSVAWAGAIATFK